MADNITKKLDEVIEKRLNEFDYYDLDSENTKQAVEAIEKLYRLRIEEQRFGGELCEKQKARESEESVKNKEIHERRIDRWVNGAITVGTAAASLVFYGVWMNRGLKFEETGTFTSSTFKGLINRFRPMK